MKGDLESLGPDGQSVLLAAGRQERHRPFVLLLFDVETHVRGHRRRAGRSGRCGQRDHDGRENDPAKMLHSTLLVPRVEAEPSTIQIAVQ